MCDVVRCANCSFCYAFPYLAADARFYEIAYYRPSYPIWKWEYQVTYETLIDMVISRNLKNFKLLEIGAGDGAFVKKVVPKLTPRENVLCTEYSEYGKNKVNSYGIACLSKDISELEFAEYEGNFDVVCMFQVLEHMDRLDILFRRLTHLTTRRAHLFIAVPNYMQREFYDLHGIREDIPPIHIGRWNKKCFEIIAGRHGWAVVRHELEPQSALSKAKKFVRLRFVNSEVAKRLDGVQNRPVRRILKAIALSVCGLNSFPEVMRLSYGNFGVSQWIHLRKG